MARRVFMQRADGWFYKPRGTWGADDLEWGPFATKDAAAAHANGEQPFAGSGVIVWEPECHCAECGDAALGLNRTSPVLDLTERGWSRASGWWRCGRCEA